MPDALTCAGACTLLEAVRRLWLPLSDSGPARRFHQVPTDEVYGSLEAPDPPFREKAPDAPDSPYAGGKAAVDHLLLACNRTYALPVTISNSPNDYEHHQSTAKPIFLVTMRWYLDHGSWWRAVIVESHCSPPAAEGCG